MVVKGAVVTQDLGNVYVLVTVCLGLHAIFGQVVGKTVDVVDAGHGVATAFAAIGAAVGRAIPRVLQKLVLMHILRVALSYHVFRLMRDICRN